MNKVNHVVFADFIKDYLVSIGVSANRIFVISHPLPDLSFTSKMQNTNGPNMYIALGHAMMKISFMI